jgi:hypothetical protein
MLQEEAMKLEWHKRRTGDGLISAVQGRASLGLWLAALMAFAVYAAIHLSAAATHDERSPELLGETFGRLLGAILWPVVIVLVASFWGEKRGAGRE